MLNHNILLIPLFIALLLFFSKKLHYRCFVLFAIIFLMYVREFEHKLVTEDYLLHQSIRFIMLSFLLFSFVGMGFRRIVSRIFTPIGIFGIFYLSSYLWGWIEGSSLINVIGDLLCVIILLLRMMRISDCREVIYAIVIFVIVGAFLTTFNIVDMSTPVFNDKFYAGLKKNILLSNLLAYQVVWFSAILSITTFLIKAQKKFIILATITLIAALLSLVTIQSRTIMISIFIAAIVALVISRKWYFVILTTVLAYVIIYYGNNILTNVFSLDVGNAFYRKLNLEDSVRLYAWNVALQRFWEMPVVGGGVGTASLLPTGMGTHSGILTILVNTGIIGVTLFFSMVFWALSKHWVYMKNATSQTERWYYTLMFIGLVAYVPRMVTDGTLFGPFLIIALISADSIYIRQRFNYTLADRYSAHKQVTLLT